MEKAYKNIGYLFILLFVFIFWGFYRTYIGSFPSFSGVNTIKHFHGLLLFGWFFLLILQPFLIKYKKYKTHKAIGILSYMLVPLIVLSIFLVSKDKFNRLAPLISKEQNIGELALNVSSMFYFSMLFGLAIIYKKKTAYHMRFIIAAALLLFSPGIGRVFENYVNLSFPVSVAISVFIAEIITVSLILYDRKHGNEYKPYVITLIFLICFHILWAFRLSAAWQVVGGKFAEIFF